jgi:hypothetical protein
MQEIQVYSVSGPESTKEYFGFLVPGGLHFLQAACERLANTNKKLQIRVCVGHLFEWGEAVVSSNSNNLTFCLHQVSVNELDSRQKGHPSSQHGVILDWLLLQHPPSVRNFIVMDPDFFMIQENGLERATKDVTDDTVTAGVAYPAWLTKGTYWDFPVVYFQIFRSGENWEFSPETANDLLPGESSKWANWIISKFSLALRSLIGLIEGSQPVLAGWRVWLAQIARTPMEIAANDPDLLRDTGFKNRKMHGNRKSTIYPNVVRVSHSSFAFKTDIWERHNPNLQLPWVPTPWYAFRHGIWEKRNFAGQGVAIQFLARIILRGRRQGPTTSLIDCGRLGLTSEQMEIFLRLNRYGADFYARHGRLLGVHLGSTAKARILRDDYCLQGLLEDIKILGRIQ